MNSSFSILTLSCWFALTLPGHSSAQACALPAPSDHETHLLWGGETRQVFIADVGGDVHIHTAEDGGRIRRSTDGGATWAFAQTPIDCSQSILDVWFDAEGKGYACGRGGKILISTDEGATWQHIDPANPVHYDLNGEPATLWRVRFLDENVGFVAGLHVFEVTTNGGQGDFATWADVKLYSDATLTTQLDLDDLELYCLDVIGVPGAFTGIAGAEWEDGSTDRGLVFHTDATVTASSIGRKWWIALDDSADMSSPGSMKEPWDIDYERGSTDLQGSRAYVVGGPGGNNMSRFYRTDDSGASWTLEGNIPVTMYGLAAMPGGYAMQCGYSGNVWSRDPVTATWTQHLVPATGAVNDILTAPCAGMHGLTEEDYVLVGAFGTQRRTSDYGTTFDYLNHTYDVTHGEVPWRTADIYFLPSDPSTGFLCGQVQLIAKTVDGGCSWDKSIGGIDDPGYNAAPLGDIEFSNTTNGIAVGHVPPYDPAKIAALWRTVDGGVNWTQGTIQGALTTDDFLVTAVSHAAGGAWWAVGVKNGGPPLVLYTRTNGSLWFQMANPPSSTVDLVDVEFISSSEGLAIGNDAGVGHAYRASFNGTAVTWTEITLTGVGALRALELEGTTLSGADGYIVGDGGVVQHWNGSSFDPVDTSTTYDGQPLTLSVDLLSVALSPDSGEVLIGAQYDNVEANATEEGLLLRYDGTAWECLRSNAGYDIRTIQLLGGGTGRILGGIHPTESATFDHGKVSDAAILYYEAAE